MRNESDPLTNRTHERFARLMARGSKGGPAYLEAVGGKVTPASAKAAAFRLTHRHPDVMARIEALRREDTVTLDDLPIFDSLLIEAAMREAIHALEEAHALGVDAGVSAIDLAKARNTLSAVASRALKLQPSSAAPKPMPAPSAAIKLLPLPTCICDGASR